MKTLHLLHQISGSHTRIRRIIIKLATYLTLIVFLNLFTACSHYFRVVSKSPYSAQTIKRYEDHGKYLILQRNNEVWHLYDLSIINDSIHAKLDSQIGYQANYLNPKEKGLNKFNKSDEPDVINAVYIYTSDSSFNYSDTFVSIPVSSISGIKYYSYAQAASRAPYIVPIVLICAAVPILLALVIGSGGGVSGI
jgi:hypothetical protein